MEKISSTETMIEYTGGSIGGSHDIGGDGG